MGMGISYGVRTSLVIPIGYAGFWAEQSANCPVRRHYREFICYRIVSQNITIGTYLFEDIPRGCGKQLNRTLQVGALVWHRRRPFVRMVTEVRCEFTRSKSSRDYPGYRSDYPVRHTTSGRAYYAPKKCVRKRAGKVSR